MGLCAARPAPGTGRLAFTYQWYRDGVVLGGAADDSLVLGSADSGRAFACQVFADLQSGTLTDAITVRAPRSLVAPSVDGDPRLGRRPLTCDTRAPGTAPTRSPTAGTAMRRR